MALLRKATCKSRHPMHLHLVRRGLDHTMGWLQWVCSFKLYVSFAEYCLFFHREKNYRSLLQKRPVVLRSLLIVAIPILIVKSSAMKSVYCVINQLIDYTLYFIPNNNKMILIDWLHNKIILFQTIINWF